MPHFRSPRTRFVTVTHFDLFFYLPCAVAVIVVLDVYVHLNLFYFIFHIYLALFQTFVFKIAANT